MNIREGMGIKTLWGTKGTITKVEMKSYNGEVWYNFRIKLSLLMAKICKQSA